MMGAPDCSKALVWRECAFQACPPFRVALLELERRVPEGMFGGQVSWMSRGAHESDFRECTPTPR
eukprot:6803765-Lingulodinium_polyedra.AAC.1